MKRIIFPVLILSMTLTVAAQDIPERKTGKPGMHHKMDKQHGHRMDLQKLNLTEEQKTQFKTQRESFRKQMEELKKNDNITVGEQKAKMEAIRKENKSKMQNILTAEQKAQIEKMKKEGKQKHEAMGKERAEKMKTRLELTAAQSAQLDKNRAEMQQKMKAIREDKEMTDEQKKEQVKELMKSQHENMKSILTEDQIKKMKEAKHRKPGNRDADRKKPVKNATI